MKLDFLNKIFPTTINYAILIFSFSWNSQLTNFRSFLSKFYLYLAKLGISFISTKVLLTYLHIMMKFSNFVI
jgi:hypothetical protein